jgi:N-acetylglutamate synthase-like GNAT family acetyltransferase
MTSDDVLIETMSAETAPLVKELIRRNLQGYDEAGSVIAATFRRLADPMRFYGVEGARFFVLRDMKDGGTIIGGAGIGSLHGLPPSEGLGEVRDLVLEEKYRGQGLGARLLKRCVDEGKALGYRRLYLETTPQMETAQKLFLRFGFRPVTQAQQEVKVAQADKVPCYFILEDL